MRNVYPWLVRNILFPFHERIKGHSTIQIWKQLECSQEWTLEKLEQYQMEKLRILMHEVYENVPYYQNLFRSLKLHPSELDTLQSLREIPLLSKDIIRNNSSDLINRNSKNLITSSTSGSTGEALVFQMGKERISMDIAARCRAHRWWGIEIGNRELVLWSSKYKNKFGKKITKYRDALLRSKLIEIVNFDNSTLDRYLSIIESYDPQSIFGYTAVIRLLSKHVMESGRVLNVPNLKVIFTTSEKLHDEDRKLIEKAFKCRVGDEYGARDAGFIAHECPYGGMHVTMEGIIVEIVDTNGNILPEGEAGEVVVTNLFSRDFPIIRYRTGDIASISKNRCSCGRELLQIKNIHGRSNDYLLNKNHALIHYTKITHVLRELDEIRSFRIIQKDLDKIVIQISVASSLDEAILEKIQDDVRKKMGCDMKVIVQQYDKIPLTTGGKHRHVINELMTRV